MRPHHNLDVWRRSIDFVVLIYQLSDRFPKDERFGLTSQLRRASVSIAANIAEGAGRKSKKEFLNFLSMAHCSASEVETELIISNRLEYLTDGEFDLTNQKLGDIGRMITGLSKHLKNKRDDESR
jgi:four helix bundle protein